jgi:hypothetical protein
LCAAKSAAGKSTLTSSLAQAPNTVLLSEDKLLSALYPEEILSVADYVRCSAAAQRDPAAGGGYPGCGQFGGADFPANTVATRAWMFTA